MEREVAHLRRALRRRVTSTNPAGTGWRFLRDELVSAFHACTSGREMGCFDTDAVEDEGEGDLSSMIRGKLREANVDAPARGRASANIVVVGHFVS